MVEIEAEDIVEVEVQYESIPCFECLLACHLSTKCPSKMKPSLLKTPAQEPILITLNTSEDLGSKDVASHLVSPIIADLDSEQHLQDQLKEKGPQPS